MKPTPEARLDHEPSVVRMDKGFNLLTYDHDFNMRVNDEHATLYGKLNLQRKTFVPFRDYCLAANGKPLPPLRSTDVHVSRNESTDEILVVRGTFDDDVSAFCLCIAADDPPNPAFRSAGVVHIVAIFLGPPKEVRRKGDLLIYNPFPSDHEFSIHRLQQETIINQEEEEEEEETPTCFTWLKRLGARVWQAPRHAKVSCISEPRKRK